MWCIFFRHDSNIIFCYFLPDWCSLRRCPANKMDDQHLIVMILILLDQIIHFFVSEVKKTWSRSQVQFFLSIYHVLLVLNSTWLLWGVLLEASWDKTKMTNHTHLCRQDCWLWKIVGSSFVKEMTWIMRHTTLLSRFNFTNFDCYHKQLLKCCW
jgi:hypothetical protein